jgi:hypothetical protein
MLAPAPNHPGRIAPGRDTPVLITGANLDYSLMGAARRRGLPILRGREKVVPEPMPFIPEPMRPRRQVDVRSIPPELRLRPVARADRSTAERSTADGSTAERSTTDRSTAHRSTAGAPVARAAGRATSQREMGGVD